MKRELRVLGIFLQVPNKCLLIKIGVEKDTGNFYGGDTTRSSKYFILLGLFKTNFISLTKYLSIINPIYYWFFHLKATKAMLKISKLSTKKL